MPVLNHLSPRNLKLLLVALPLLLAGAYYVALAADRFVSESVITVRQASQSANAVPGAALLLAGLTPASREDTLYLARYVHSLDLLRKLDAELKLREHFSRRSADLLFRLDPEAPIEDVLDYYRARVEVLHDDVSGLLTLRVQGFEPAFAQALNRSILDQGEKFVNEFSQRMAREQMQFAEAELARAAERVQQAQARLLAFQTRHRLLDPPAQAVAASTLAAELQATLAREETELKNALTYLNDSSHQVRALRNRIDALRQQLDLERLRSTGGQGSRLNALAAEFQALQLQVGFAQDAYKLALSAVENARIDATRKLKSVVVVESSSLPEEARYPRRLYNLFTLAVVCLLLYGITRLVVTTIRDHQD
ncbi:MAG: capsular biosynthesis protein [Burkholderiales bacterium]|nr:capsular biosynthesis protein [Burkholderiales bacterium]